MGHVSRTRCHIFLSIPQRSTECFCEISSYTSMGEIIAAKPFHGTLGTVDPWAHHITNDTTSVIVPAGVYKDGPVTVLADEIDYREIGIVPATRPMSPSVYEWTTYDQQHATYDNSWYVAEPLPYDSWHADPLPYDSWHAADPMPYPYMQSPSHYDLVYTPPSPLMSCMR